MVISITQGGVIPATSHLMRGRREYFLTQRKIPDKWNDNKGNRSTWISIMRQIEEVTLAQTLYFPTFINS